ncbi:MAG: prolyl oligopeptidase family serine peptidase [Litorimonas sp.]
MSFAIIFAGHIRKFGDIMRLKSTFMGAAACLAALSFISLPNVYTVAHAAPAAKHFGKLPNIYDAALSPDATLMAAVINNKGDYLVRIESLKDPSIESRFVGLGEGVKPAYVKWVNNKQVIISFWQSQKTSSTPIRTGFLYTLNTETMEGKILVDPSKVKKTATGSRLQQGSIFRQFNNVVVDWLEDDPLHILMAYSDEDNNNLNPDLRKVNVETGKDTIVKRGVEGVQSWYTDLKGDVRVGQGREDDNKAAWVMRIKDAASGNWNSSDKYPGLDAGVSIHGFTSNPNELIISSYAGKDTIGLYVYDLSSKAVTRKIYHNDKFDASGVILSSDGGEIIGARYTADTQQTEMIGNNDTILQAMRRDNVGYTVDYVDQSADGQTVLFKLSNPYDPGGMMMVKGSSGTPVNLGMMRPDLPNPSLGEVIGVKYKARDGQKIPSYVTLPPMVTDTSQLKNLPFIVLPHGGPYGRDSKRFDYFAQFFATRGYGVLQMNFRGSDGFGKAYKEAGRNNWTIMQEDVEDGTRWLFEKGYADPKRTCIAGWSYGGYAALMGAAKNPELYNCAISMAGVTDIRALIRDESRYRFGKASAKNFVGAGFSDKDDIKANSPVKIAGDMSVPLFLAHGELDQQVHFSQYKRMKKALKKSNAKVTYMEFEDEDHYLSNQDNRIKFFEGLDKFLSKYNGPSEYMAP